MFLLFETICIENGVPKYLKWHEMRMNRSRKEVWNRKDSVKLEKMLTIPDEYKTGVVRCNIEYGREIGPVTFRKYDKKKVHSLKVVECNTLDYHLKFSDRTLLEDLLLMKEDCDEIVIVKDGMITDTSMSNLIFYDGIHWFTPQFPLLKGTCRQRLLEENRISEKKILLSDVMLFEGLKLINAMRDPDEEELIPVIKLKRHT
jgi:4-amino-4-deoxychorismate lyase